jgi:hypothetical protein
MSCDHTESAGNTTEIENAIAIRVFEEGTPAAKVDFRVLPSWFVADTNEATTETEYAYTGETDEDGWMRIDGHLEGSFTVQFSKDKYSIVTSYTLDNLTPHVTIDSVALAKPGSIKGSVDLPDSADYAWIYMQGTERVEKTDRKGAFAISNLPAGNLKLRAWVPKVQKFIAQTDVSVPANDTLDVGNVSDTTEAAPIKRTMKINPRSLISSWMRPLPIPSVLVLRLDSTFNFFETQDDGSDVHLLDADGNPLPIEIDSWDKGIQSGAINIRIESKADTARLWTLEWGDSTEAPQKKSDVWKDLSDSLLWAFNSVQILDFENPNFKNDLPEPLTPMDWYVQAHEGATVYDSVADDIRKGVIDSGGGAFESKILQVNYKAEKPEYVVIGTRICETPHDLSRLDSVEVWIKTDGKFEIILETIIESDTNFKASYKAEGDGSWTHYAVRPQDFDTTDTVKYHGWDVTRNRITRFTIFAYDGSSILVDNIRMYGINRDDLK